MHEINECGPVSLGLKHHESPCSTRSYTTCENGTNYPKPDGILGEVVLVKGSMPGLDPEVTTVSTDESCNEKLDSHTNSIMGIRVLLPRSGTVDLTRCGNRDYEPRGEGLEC